jgi:hypothetical protein
MGPPKLKRTLDFPLSGFGFPYRMENLPADGERRGCSSSGIHSVSSSPIAFPARTRRRNGINAVGHGTDAHFPTIIVQSVEPVAPTSHDAKSSTDRRHLRNSKYRRTEQFNVHHLY